MSDTKLPIGVIGLERMGEVHARILARRIQGAQLMAVADLDPARAQGFVEGFDVPYWYDNLDDLLARAASRSRPARSSACGPRMSFAERC